MLSVSSFFFPSRVMVLLLMMLPQTIDSFPVYSFVPWGMGGNLMVRLLDSILRSVWSTVFGALSVLAGRSIAS
jgi:hypothetical protein